ncbi:flagellar hook-associated protein FlgK [Bdellovibrionota bacterium FG-1]
MGLPNIFQTGRSGMMSAKAAIATTGHNIANASNEGYSRQRVLTEAATPGFGPGHHYIGNGSLISRVERINDEYIEKQLRDAGRDLAHMEEKDLMLRQTEDIFNEMNGDGLNRLVSKFFNEFRRLSNDPDNEAVRQAVRESSQAMVNDFRRIRKELEGVRQHVDARIEGYTREINAYTDQIRDLNIKIKVQETGGSVPNDLYDKRDLALKKLGSFMDLNMHKTEDGSYVVEVSGVGPLVAGPEAEKFSVERSQADDQGKTEGSLDIKTSASAQGNVTHLIKGGKIGALLDVRDSVLSTVQERLDDLAFSLTNSVNAIHQQGVTRDGFQGVSFFKELDQQDRAAEFFDLSDAVKNNVNHIAAAAAPDSPGDNRIAIAISGLQGEKLMNSGRATMDDWYNSIVSDVGVASAKNKFGMNQAQDIATQLGKMRDQISGVSIDEETANLMQFQQAFGASAKVIQVADECLKTVLDLRR